jgi:rod shape-determining protein MreD
MRPILDSVTVRTGLVLVVVLVLQVTLIPNTRVAGSSADLMLLFSLCAAVAAGAEVGAITAFAYGLAFDIMLQTPFGLSALVFGIAAWVLGVVRTTLSRDGWLFSGALMALSTVVSVGLYAGLARVFGEPFLGAARLGRIMVVEAGFNAVLAPVALRICRWTVADADPRYR